jgi:threonine-phosphate decarboxylase
MESRVVKVALPVHGGDVARVTARYGGGDWLDFSANINPAGPPQAALDALQRGAVDVASLTRYPTAHDRALCDALATLHGVDSERIVVANGAAALVEAFVRTVAPRRCLVPQPAFSEYERALAAQKCELIAFRLTAESNFALDVPRFIAMLADQQPDAAIINNPHNPSGACVPRTAMAAIVEAARTLGVALLIDEAFVDFVPSASVVAELHHENVLVLRSLTKFFALPALRVGYGVASPAFAQALTARIPSWPITSLAADAARAALADAPYALATRDATVAERDALASALRRLGLRVYPSAANFLLFSAPLPSGVLTDRLASEHRIIVRDCASYAGMEDGGFIRVGVRTRDENARLVAALQRLI